MLILKAKIKWRKTMIKTLIFDLDGTLLNTLVDLAGACNLALKKFNFPTHPVDDYRYFIGQGVRELARKMLPKDLQNNDEWIDLIIKTQTNFYSKNYMNKTTLYPYAKSTLKKLNSMNINLFVFSNKLDNFTKMMVRETLPDIKFVDVVGLSDKYPRKPDPTAIVASFKKHKIALSDVMFVGDSKVDCDTAKNLKIKMIGCNYGFRGKAELVANGAAYTIDNLKQILDIVERENKVIVSKKVKK
jgi:phosphoglycolate phosphatase